MENFKSGKEERPNNETAEDSKTTKKKKKKRERTVFDRKTQESYLNGRFMAGGK